LGVIATEVFMRLAFASVLVVAAVASAIAQGTSQNTQEILRQRLIIQERINKGWDVQMENRGIGSRAAARPRRGSATLHCIRSSAENTLKTAYAARAAEAATLPTA
jgi:hypothetical protein